MTQVNVQPFEIEVRTRKGTILRADVYLPADRKGPFPTLVAASPYQKALRHLPATFVFPFIEYGPMQLYLDEGYAYVIVDLPGSGVSEGTWDPVSREEGEAIHDAIEHVAVQPWSTGAVGMIGQSYFAWSQWNAARTRPPHLRTIVPYDGATDMYRDWMYHGGIPTQGFLNLWLVGSVLLQHQAQGHDFGGGGRFDVMADILSHRFDDEWHQRRSPFWELDQVDIPVFSIGVWGKATLHLRGNFMGFEKVKGPKKLLITEPDSYQGAQRLFHDEQFHREELLPWYDHHLKGVDNAVMDKPAVRFFVNRAGRIASAPCWPPADTVAQSFYLSGNQSGVVASLNDGSLTDRAPETAQSSTSWSYPDDRWMAGVSTFRDGIPDHVALVNTFTTEPFQREQEYTGLGVLELFASSDQQDLDLMVKVCVLSQGRHGLVAQKVTQGWLRASHRKEDEALSLPLRPFHTHQEEEKLEPNKPYLLRVELLPMSFVVKPGERLRLEISNYESVIIDQPMIHWYGQKVGTDTYHHDAARPSRLVLSARVGEK